MKKPANLDLQVHCGDHIKGLHLLTIGTNEKPIYRLYIGPNDNATEISQNIDFTKKQLENLIAFLINRSLKIEHFYAKTF
jgi:hypothetical protein